MMLRRSILALSHRKLSIRRFPRQVSTQMSPILCPRREFSSACQQNVSPQPGSTSKPSESGRNLSKVFVGGVAVGTCFIAAYSTGYLDDILGKRQQNSTAPLDPISDYPGTEKLPKGGTGLQDPENIRESIPVHTGEDSKSLSSDVEDSKESTEGKSVLDPLEDSHKHEGERELSAKTLSHLKPKEEYTHVKEELPSKGTDDIHAKSSSLKGTADDGNLNYQKIENSDYKKSSGQNTSNEQHKVEENLPTINEAGAVFQGNNMNEDLPVELKSEDESETSLRALEDLNDAYVSKDGKLIMDFLQAIHAAEQRQAELDSRIFAEEQRAMKDKYEKELKDARASELMYAEEVAMLEKEVKKERAKAAAALKSLQERLEQRLKMELEEKDRAAELKLKELSDFTKAELAASIAQEKAAQVERMAEADLNINALCMAFYARSEEARQTQSIHKLALGALALEDALSNGLPVQGELDALHVCIDGVDKDSLLQLALSSLPEDVRVHGTDNPLQLHQKFDALKGALRHFSLIPPDGGGILAHSLAHMASFLKVKEGDQSGDGIESAINKVESLLAQGKLVEAANALEDGVKGSKAAEVVNDWVIRARNRAIAEQALILLQSYTTSVSLS